MPVSRIRSTVVCTRDNEILLIELRDPTTQKRMWSLPGGKIEPHEQAFEAAVRETLEETGYQVTLDRTTPIVSHYLFRWDGQVFDVTNHWFKGTPTKNPPAVVDDAAYLLGHRWLPITRVAALLSYHPHVCETTLKLFADHEV